VVFFVLCYLFVLLFVACVNDTIYLTHAAFFLPPIEISTFELIRNLPRCGQLDPAAQFEFSEDREPDPGSSALVEPGGPGATADIDPGGGGGGGGAAIEPGGSADIEPGGSEDIDPGGPTIAEDGADTLSEEEDGEE